MLLIKTENFKKRLIGSWKLVIACLICVVFGIFANPNNILVYCSKNNFTNMIFSILLVFSNVVFFIVCIFLILLISKEIKNCFSDKLNLNYFKFVLCTLIALYIGILIYFGITKLYFDTNSKKQIYIFFLSFGFSSFLLINVLNFITICKSDISKQNKFLFFLTINLIFFALIVLLTIVNMSYITNCIYILLIPIIFDSMQYIMGKKTGKTKISKISPNKTLEGYLYGGIVCFVIMFLIGLTWIQMPQKNCFWFYFEKLGKYSFFILFTAIFFFMIISAYGDLYFSLIKRKNGIKDFSNLIIGHGGILDRFDSWIFVLCGVGLFIFIDSIYVLCTTGKIIFALFQ